MSIATEITIYGNETWNYNLKCLKHIAHFQNKKKNTQNKDVENSGTNYFIIINYTMG